jgi:hypothetical protein
MQTVEGSTCCPRLEPKYRQGLQPIDWVGLFHFRRTGSRTLKYRRLGRWVGDHLPERLLALLHCGQTPRPGFRGRIRELAIHFAIQMLRLEESENVVVLIAELYWYYTCRMAASSSPSDVTGAQL